MKKDVFLRDVLPYGAYVHKDGSETLYDRSYRPIATRGADRRLVTPASGFIAFVWQGWFFDDGNPPWGVGALENKARDSMQTCQRAMFNFMTGRPIDHLFHNTNKE